MLANAARILEEALLETPDIEEIRCWEKSSSVTLPLFLRGLEWDIKAGGLQRLLLLWRSCAAWKSSGRRLLRSAMATTLGTPTSGGRPRTPGPGCSD